MSQQFIPLSVPNFSGNEKQYVNEAVISEWVSTGGSKVSEFEEKIAEYTHMPRAVACNSGTSGLHLAMLMAGVGRGDEVLAPALTFIAAVNPIRYAGAEPVFIGCGESLCLCPALAGEWLAANTEQRDGKCVNRHTGAHVKALLAVHVFGNMANMPGLVELCRKYDYQPIMWSDMFFSMSSPIEAYYDKNTVIPEEVIKLVPPEVTLTFWDYYHLDPTIYDHMIDQHRRFHNPMLFAGGAWKWSGLTPVNHFGQKVAKVALERLRDKEVDQVMVTAWGDNGGECSVFAVLPTLQTYAEGCWSGDLSDEHLSRRLKTCADADLEGFLDLDLANYPPNRNDNDTESINCSRYLLYQDALAGLFDRLIVEGTDAQYASYVPVLEKRQAENPRWAYLFETQKALCHALAVKSELGLKLKKAYDAGDRAALASLADHDIPEAVQRVEALAEAVRHQWLTDNKRFGLDVQQIRYGGLCARLEEAARAVRDYLDGRVEAIDELEQKRLFFDCRPDDDGQDIRIQPNVWSQMVTVNTL